MVACGISLTSTSTKLNHLYNQYNPNVGVYPLVQYKTGDRGGKGQVEDVGDVESLKMTLSVTFGGFLLYDAPPVLVVGRTCVIKYVTRVFEFK
jgi:hypothetical protein